MLKGRRRNALILAFMGTGFMIISIMLASITHLVGVGVALLLTGITIYFLGMIEEFKRLSQKR